MVYLLHSWLLVDPCMIELEWLMCARRMLYACLTRTWHILVTFFCACLISLEAFLMSENEPVYCIYFLYMSLRLFNDFLLRYLNLSFPQNSALPPLLYMSTSRFVHTHFCLKTKETNSNWMEWIGRRVHALHVFVVATKHVIYVLYIV